MTVLSAGLRFLLELCGIAALAAWGWMAGGGGPAGLVLAVGAAGTLIAVWATLVAPKATNPIPQTSRMLIGSGLLLGCAALLVLGGQVALGALFAVVNIVNTAALLVLGGPGGFVHAGRAADPPDRS